MSTEEFYPLPSPIFLSEDNSLKIFPHSTPCSDEVHEGLECFLFVITLGEVFVYFIVTVVLFAIFPPLVLVGILHILVIILQFFKSIQKLE
jgi:hypothetical protein